MESVTDAAGARGAEERGRALALLGARQSEGQTGVRPTRGQIRCNATPLVDQSHAAVSIMKAAMAKVEKKPKETTATEVLSDERLHELFREMLLIRRFEEKVEERFRAGELPGFLHVCIGQEAVASGVCAALEPDDVIASTHRAHGHTIAKGTHVNAVMAELYGKLEGCSHGYGGSMHLYDVEKGNLGANAVVGGGFPAITAPHSRSSSASSPASASPSSATAPRTPARSTSRSTSPSSGRCRRSSCWR